MTDHERGQIAHFEDSTREPTITVQKLSSGYYHVRGDGPCEWSQPPHWPCSEDVLRTHAFPEASERFIQSALEAMPEDNDD
jgi:hypothetical protein